MAKTAQNAAAKAMQALAADEGRADDGEKRVFMAAHNVILGGEAHPPGSEIEITHEEWKSLRADGSVTGEWD